MGRFWHLSFLPSVSVGLSLFAGPPAPPPPPGIECRECFEYVWPQYGNHPPVRHYFNDSPCSQVKTYPRGAVSVTAAQEGVVGVFYVAGTAHCSACGGTSECHENSWADDPISYGPCHVRCHDFYRTTIWASTLSDMRKGLETGDMALVASAILRGRTEFSIEYIPEGGRIDVFLPCDPKRAAHTLAVLPAARSELGRRMAERSASATLLTE